MAELRRATQQRFLLAEGPVWDASRDRILWVDIHGGLVVEGRLDQHLVTPTGTHRFDEMVGAVAVSHAGALLVATGGDLVVQHADGRRTRVATVVPSGSGRRLNDGSTDPQGRFLVGSLSLAGPSQCELLVRLERDGSLTRLDDDLTLSNGLAWSIDGSQLFSVDTERQTVFVRDYGAGTDAVGPRRPHLVVEGGYPDGVAIDAEDHLWIAVWGAGEVRRYDPQGHLVESLATGAPHTSSVAFASDDLRTLVVTTASVDLTDQQLRAAPASGHLLAARVEVPGVPIPEWSGLD